MRNSVFLPIVFAATLVALLFSSCTITYKDSTECTASITRVNLQCQPFNSITSYIASDMVYVESDTFYVETEGSKERIKNIKLDTTDSMLVIRSKVDDGRLNGDSFDVSDDGNTITIDFGDKSNSRLNIIVHAPKLNDVVINGACSFVSKMIDTDNFAFVSHGSSSVEIDSLNACTVAVQQQGAGDVKMNVKAKKVSVEVAGSGDGTMTLTDVDDISYSIAGSGDADLNLKDCKKIQVAIAGSGDVALRGNVEDFKQYVAGSGDIDINGLKIGK